MGICLIGVDYNSGPIEIRQGLAFNQINIPEKLKHIKGFHGVNDVVIVSTCNRTEIYLEIDEGFESKLVINWWLKQSNNHNTSASQYIYQKLDYYAIEHLFRVACGLKSMVIGEAQILGQIKKSFAMAKLTGNISRTLHRLFDHTFNIAKQVRTETEIGLCPMSIGHSTVLLAKNHIGGFNDISILIIGAGETAGLVLKHIKSVEPKAICVCNRTLNKAKDLAERNMVSYADIQQLSNKISESDLIISTVDVQSPIINHEAISGIEIKDRLFIDLSMPNSISPDIISNPNVSLLSVDDIQSVIKQSTCSRKKASILAEKIIENGITNYCLAVRADYADGAICNIRNHVDNLVLTEYEKSLKQLKNGQNPAEVLMRFSHRIKNKWLHHPCVTMKKASENGRDDILDVAQDFFGLGSFK